MRSRRPWLDPTTTTTTSTIFFLLFASFFVSLQLFPFDFVFFFLFLINSNLTVQSAAGTVEPVISAQIIRLPNELTDPERIVCVAYLPLLPNWRSTGKVWSTGIKELSQTALPAGYTSN